MKDYSRLIEHAFPLRQASMDSVHEKAVRHGHISTLHLWPARRPLAASRAAILATLLPDPGTPEARKELCEKIGGKLKTEKDKEGRVKEVTEGGILRWKREVENKSTLDWFREELRKANGGRVPKVLDPFSGGGAIPLEAMRLGCDVTAADLNPVAWFILKCTLEYPQMFAGQKRPLPHFIRDDADFMEDFFTVVHGLKGARLRKALQALGLGKTGQLVQDEANLGELTEIGGISLEADLAWHVRAWGRRIFTEARKQLAPLYATYADWQPLKAGQSFEPQPMRFIEPDEHGVAIADKFNENLSKEYLENERNPRWVAKPTVAYLWARTVTCKHCRAIIPLLKTRWLCKTTNRRIRLLMEGKTDGTGVAFSIEHNVPERGGNAAQKREHDKKVGLGTISKAGAKCPCCETIMTSDDIRYEAKGGRVGEMITAVVVVGPDGKEFRLPTNDEVAEAANQLDALSIANDILPNSRLEERFSPQSTRSISAQLYGVSKWADLFTKRQIRSLATLGREVSNVHEQVKQSVGDDGWAAAVSFALCASLDRLLCFTCVNACWKPDVPALNWAFSRFSISLLWDYAEGQPLSTAAGSFLRCNERIAAALDCLLPGIVGASKPNIRNESATDSSVDESYDLIITDPPYYQAVSYADLADFSYVWLRGYLPLHVQEFAKNLSGDEREAVQHIREDKNRQQEKDRYERLMSLAFKNAYLKLSDHGRFVCVFAHKDPNAWQTLVSAVISAGFTVSGSWPIQTESPTRQRASSASALASSIWLVCRKRDPLAKIGWDNRVMTEMRGNIAAQLREFWDAGIRGPDFVWAATGPAMEAYSKYPAVKKANSPTGEFLSVTEFLDAVRRIVIDFVVGRVLHIESGTERLDPITSYYLLHRSDFGFEKAPSGACILYAVSCGLSDAELERTWNLVKVKGSVMADPQEGDDETAQEESDPAEEMGGGEFILRTWKERKEKRMGFESVGGREIPLIDRVHRLMHLWRDGDLRKVDDYLDEYALRRNDLFMRVVQSLIELSEQGGEERSLLESLSKHLGAKAAKADTTRSLGLNVEI